MAAHWDREPIGDLQEYAARLLQHCCGAAYPVIPPSIFALVCVNLAPISKLEARQTFLTQGVPHVAKVDWRLTGHDGVYKISDVVIDGLSMAVTGRSEFQGVAERNGGQPQAILAVMRQETANAIWR